jgi:hypothetical protein
MTRCEKRVHGSGPGGARIYFGDFHQCKRRAVEVIDGKHLCKQHARLERERIKEQEEWDKHG